MEVSLEKVEIQKKENFNIRQTKVILTAFGT